MTDKARAASRVPKDGLTVAIVKALAWPALVLAVVVLFRDHIAPQNVELNSKGVKISFYLLQAAEHSGAEGGKAARGVNVNEIARSASQASSVSLQGSKVLWVDDNPDNNVYERNALEQLGLQFVLATSTSEALPLLHRQSFDLVITDFFRRDDPQGGYTLLAEVKKSNPNVPVIIYSSSATPAFVAEAKRRGAFTETNEPRVLFDEVINAIKNPL